MFHPRALVPVAVSALILAGAIVLPALAVTQGGPLIVNDAHDAFAIHAAQTGTGNGIVSNASTGTAIYGVTNASNDNNPGVIGLDTNTNGIGVLGKGYEAGVKGQSNNQNGVVGVTLSNATGASYAGVEGIDQSTGGHHYGMYAASANVGLEAVGLGPSAYGIDAISRGVAIRGTGTTFGSTGVWGRANNGAGVLADGSGGATSLFVRTDGAGLPIQVLCTCPGIITMSLDASGNLTVIGQVTQYGHPMLIARAANGPPRVTYGPQATSPSIEDTGEGRIAGGVGYVQIDPAFAATLNPRAPYTVLVTPEGDSRGLYVFAKTPRGFYVRESMGGRSSMEFGYRIVGRPAADDAPRLPVYVDRLKQQLRPRLPVR